MGEIKSTLDLVMEKTSNLKLSDEEKQEQKQRENENRIRGLLQKYADGLLTKKQLILDYKVFREDAGLSDDKFLINDIMNRLDPDQDNQFLLEVLEEGCRIDASSIRAIIDGHRHHYNKAARRRSERLKEALARQHGISGSAVLPNLEADDEWQRQVREMHSGLEVSLSQAKLKPLAD